MPTQPDEQRAAMTEQRAAFEAWKASRVYGDEGEWAAWQACASRLSALPAGGGWIPVAQRLPEDGLPVMVFTPAMKGEDERIDFEFRDDGCWYHHNDCYDHFMAVGGSNAVPGEVCTGPGTEAPYTHWMPLPAAPQQQENPK